MAQLAIKGHPTRGKEVIQLLEMLGDKNKNSVYSGKDTFHYYYIDNETGYIRTKLYTDDCWTKLTYNIFTLEDFLEKFPYKIGDKVTHSDYKSPLEIVGMKWEDDSIKYEVYTNDYGYWFSVDELQPYKEETMEEPKELIIGFIKDDNGDWVLNTHKDYEIKEIEGKYKVIKKKPQYPKDYEECYKIMKIHSSYECAYNQNLLNKINNFYKLLLCRDTYWKIAGEQMGLGKPWEPDCTDDTLKYGIRTYRNKINCYYTFERNGLLLFPTEEMQNEFYKNFRELIEQCKELL